MKLVAPLALCVLTLVATPPVTAAAVNSLAANVSPECDLACWQSQFEKRTFITRSGDPLPYRIATPKQPSRQPLVLVLHGSGAMGSDNERQLGPFAAAWAQLLEDGERAPIVVVPQVAERSADYFLFDGLPCASRPGPSFGKLVELVDAVAAEPTVDRTRIYVVGFSMGASAALQLASARQRLFAGALVFSPVPPPMAVAADLKNLPLVVVHGTEDTENPFATIRDWAEALRALGGRIRFLPQEGQAHNVPADMLTDEHWRRRLVQEGGVPE